MKMSVKFASMLWEAQGGFKRGRGCTVTTTKFAVATVFRGSLALRCGAKMRIFFLSMENLTSSSRQTLPFINLSILTFPWTSIAELHRHLPWFADVIGTSDVLILQRTTIDQYQVYCTLLLILSHVYMNILMLENTIPQKNGTGTFPGRPHCHCWTQIPGVFI